MLWDPEARKCVKVGNVSQNPEKPKVVNAATTSSLPPNQQSRAVAVNSKTGAIAVGVNNGETHIFDGFKNF